MKLCAAFQSPHSVAPSLPHLARWLLQHQVVHEPGCLAVTMRASVKQRRNFPAIGAIAPPEAMTAKLSMPKLGLLRTLSWLCPELRGHKDIENASKRAQAIPAITPQEFLF